MGGAARVVPQRRDRHRSVQDGEGRPAGCDDVAERGARTTRGRPARRSTWRSRTSPGEKDFDPTSAFAETVVDAIRASGLPARQLIVQSFWPANLDVVEQELPGVQTSFLTAAGEGGSEYAASRGYEWWSPTWPVTKEQVDQAHALGVKVVPWTVDTADAVRAVAAAGADAVITNDPVMARQALGCRARWRRPPRPHRRCPRHARRPPSRLRHYTGRRADPGQREDRLVSQRPRCRARLPAPRLPDGVALHGLATRASHLQRAPRPLRPSLIRAAVKILSIAARGRVRKFGVNPAERSSFLRRTQGGDSGSATDGHRGRSPWSEDARRGGEGPSVPRRTCGRVH